MAIDGTLKNEFSVQETVKVTKRTTIYMLLNFVVKTREFKVLKEGENEI